MGNSQHGQTLLVNLLPTQLPLFYVFCKLETCSDDFVKQILKPLT